MHLASLLLCWYRFVSQTNAFAPSFYDGRTTTTTTTFVVDPSSSGVARRVAVNGDDGDYDDETTTTTRRQRRVVGLPFAGFNENYTPIAASDPSLVFLDDDDDPETDRRRRAAFASLGRRVDEVGEGPSSSSSSSSSSRRCSLVWNRDRELDHSRVVPINSLLFRRRRRRRDDEQEEDQEEEEEEEETMVVVVLPSSRRVDAERLETVVSSSSSRHRWELVPSEEVEDWCGFPPGSVPPLGHTTPDGRPLRVLVDRSLTSTPRTKGYDGTPATATTEVVDGVPTLVATAAENDDDNDDDDPTLLGGGGHPKIGLWISASALIACDETEVVDVARCADDDDEDVATARSPAPPDARVRPYFSVSPPDARRVRRVLDSDLPNPFAPESLRLVGRVNGVRRMAARLHFLDLAPVDYDVVGDRRIDAHVRPWRSAADDGDMAVQLVAGKTFCERRGRTVGAATLRKLRVGQLVLVEGRTNVGNRESLRNWIDKRSLDVVVFDLEILQNTNTVAIESTPTSGKTKTSTHLKRIATDPPRTTKPVSSSSDATFKAGCLKLTDVFEQGPPRVTTVDDASGVADFRRALEALVATDDDDGSENDDGRTSPPLLVGVDCEWRPNFLLGSPDEPQPVLLLQISLQRSAEVFLFDLQALLRPCLAPDAETNGLERVTSDALAALFDATRFAKVGFQLAGDLQRLAGSYPHVPAFRSFRSVVETSTVARKVRRLEGTERRRGADHAASLAVLARAALGRPLDKDEQVSDWAARPLTEAQIAYAALDAAVAPALLEKLLERAGARWTSETDVSRFDPDADDVDEVFRNTLASYRFLFPGPPENDEPRTTTVHDSLLRDKLKARRVVSERYVVTQWWRTGDDPPAPPTLPLDDDGAYVDVEGETRVPCSAVSVRDAVVERLLGRRAGRSKDACLGALLLGRDDDDDNDDASSTNVRLDYPARAGYVETADRPVLFVNMPRTFAGGEPSSSAASRRGGGRRGYPNEWRDDGRELTWYLRDHEWNGGNSRVARSLRESVENDDDVPSSSRSPFALLFVRAGRGEFLFCGRVAPLPARDDDDDENRGDGANLVRRAWDLLELRLRLLDWERLRDVADFARMTTTRTATTETTDGDQEGDREGDGDAAEAEKKDRNTNVSRTTMMAEAVVEGDLVGAMGLALDAGDVPRGSRSVELGITTLKHKLLECPDEQLAQRAMDELTRSIVP